MDADACPQAVKAILYRAAERARVRVILVANTPLRLPPSDWLGFRLAPAGADAADQLISQQVQAGDLVITADIPLAAQVVSKGGQALNPRGQLYTAENVHQILVMRNLMSELRDLGERTGGPSPLSQKDRQAFANQLDSWLQKNLQP